MGKYLYEFNVGDVVTNNDGEVFEIKQKFDTGNIKVFVKECEDDGYCDINHNFLKKNKTYTVNISLNNWELVSTNNSVNNSDIEKFEKNIQKMQNELDDAKKTLEQMKKKKIPELIVGQMYIVPDNNQELCRSTILILNICDNICKFIQFFDDCSDGIEINHYCVDSFNDGTLIHLDSSEQKKFSKQLFELTKHYA